MAHWTEGPTPPRGHPACRYCLTVIRLEAPETVVEGGWHYCLAACRTAFIARGGATAAGLAGRGGLAPHVPVTEEAASAPASPRVRTKPLRFPLVERATTITPVGAREGTRDGATPRERTRE